MTSPGCAIKDGQTIDCRTEHEVGKFDLALDKRVVSGPRATVGDNVRYRLQVSNRGPDAAPAPIRLVDKLPKGLELRKARGKGWKCKTRKAADKVICVRNRDLGPDRTAPPVFVVAKATKEALGGRLVNTAQVSSNGDMVRSNNRDNAGVSVVEVPPLPSIRFRFWPREWL